MHGAMRRNWWRTVAVAVLGGASALGAIGVEQRLRADPVPAVKGTPVESSDPVWTRSSTPPAPPPPAANPVRPASAQIPATAIPRTGIPVVAPPAVGPVVVPAIPEFKPMPIPMIPVVPPPALLPAPMQPAPSAPPAKSADPVNPAVPATPDFNLRPGNDGNSVKPDAPNVPPIPVVPPGSPPAEPPGAAVTQRAKPPEVHLAPTVRDVYAIPGAAAVLPIPQPPTPQPPGASPMTIPSRSTTIAAVTGIALAFAPTSTIAAPQGTDDPVQLRKDLDAANKKLEEADKEIKRLSALLDGKKDERGFRMQSDPGAVEDIKQLKDRVAALEKQVAAMQNSTSFKPPVTGKGTIRIVNEYPVAVSIIINEKSYRVEPGTTLSVDVPAGEFNYQLLQAGVAATPVRSTIKEKEVVTLRVK